MAPKKGKEPVASEKTWRTKIEEAHLNEPSWTVKVVVIESAGEEQDFIYLTKFEQYCRQEKRFVIKNISRVETTFMINQLGGDKKVKDDNLRVFEEGQAYLKEKKDIPSDLLGLIIKHLILKMKDEYLFIRRQKSEVKEGLRRESATMIDKAEVRGSVTRKAPESESLPPPSTKKGKKDDLSVALPQLEEGKKYYTSLRVKGEEWRDRTYVDDYPIDGPNLYVAITGFLDGNLPSTLVKIGIPVVAVVQVRINPSLVKVPSSLLRGTKRGQSPNEVIVTEKTRKFWDDIHQTRINADIADELKNTAFVIFSPPYWDTDCLSGNPDKIYDEICYLMYDVQDLGRQHKHFLDNVTVYHIPEEIEDARLKQLYHQLIDDIPLECVTLYSVMDSLLHVVVNEECAITNSRSLLLTASPLNPARDGPAPASNEDKPAKAQRLVTKLINTLCKTETNKKKIRTTYGEEPENYKDPLIIKYGDYAKYSTFHIANINLNNIVKSTLLSMPIHRLWNNQSRPDEELEAKINFHVNILLSCLEREDVETTELNRLLHILSCRKLFNNKSSLKKQHLPPSSKSEFKKAFLKRSAIAEPLSRCPADFQKLGNTSPSFPSMTKSEDISEVSQTEDSESRHLEFLFNCPDISELVTAAEIANNKPISHIIDEFEFYEDFSGIRAFQVLLDAFNKFNCVDYKYCEVTDSFALMFFNSHDKQNIARDEWRCHLPTPLCLQDYFDFILDEHYNWIQNEEKMYDEALAMKEQAQSLVKFDAFAEASCIENMNVATELLMEGSLKYKDIIVTEECATEMSIKSSNTKTASASDEDGKSSSKTPATSTPKKIGRSIIMHEVQSESSIDIISKPFYGYDLSDRRVEVFGKDESYFSKDGTRVTAMYTLLIPNNLEYICLNVLPGNSTNEFWMHRALGENIGRDIVDLCESFRIVCKDNLAIYVKKESYQVSYPTVKSTSSLQTKPKETLGWSPQILDQNSFHSLHITWPNGLITESVHEEDSSNISHIRQQFVKPIADVDEVKRCITLNGEVIIFKKSGDIEVLRPDASYIKITRCEKRILTLGIPEDLTIKSSDKSRKTKDKGKSKQSSSAKSSKNFAYEEEKAPEPKIEYKLYIDEYESVDADGYRLKWIHDIPYFIEGLLKRTARDHCTGEVFSRRVGGCDMLISQDGCQIVTFPDNTKIITYYVIEDAEIYPEWNDEEKEHFELIDSELLVTDFVKLKVSKTSGKSFEDNSEKSTSSISKKLEEEKNKERTDGYISVNIIYTIENGHFPTVSINKATEKITTESPNGTIVAVYFNNTLEISLDSVTSATFNGENLVIKYEACQKCGSQTNCDVTIRRSDTSSVNKINQSWLKMEDSFCKWISVNEEGDINLINQEVMHEEENALTDENAKTKDKADIKSNGKSESSVTSHTKCREIYQANDVRFFILKRDLKCSEIIHRALVKKYMNHCKWLPWCSATNYQAFADYRTLHSVLTPINITETEKWLMETKLNKPSYLTYQHLKKDCGKGFYHWMRPYERFDPKPIQPEAVLLPHLPNAFIIRTLEQQWDDKTRDRLSGAKELIKAILRYRRVMTEDMDSILRIPVVNVRQESERRTEEAVQDLAHALYENLKRDLSQALKRKARLTVTTRPWPPEPTAASRKDEEESLDFDEMYKKLEKDRAHSAMQLERAQEMDPALKKYLRCRAADLEEENFNKYLLREGSVPPYFQNVLGGAIWWDLQNVSGEGVNKVERKKMKCVCIDANSCSHRNLTI